MSTGASDNLMPVGSLWIGEKLSWMEFASIQSFLDLGHDYCLYSYRPIDNVPEKTTLCDAREIWDTDNIEIYKQANSPALHADIFRVMMLRQTGRAWVDTDVIALRPFKRELEWCIGHERQDKIELGNAVMGMPAHSKTLELLHEFMTTPQPVPPWWSGARQQRLREARASGEKIEMGDMAWGTAGPQALTYFATKTGEIKNAQKQEVFFPVSFQERKMLVQPESRDVLEERVKHSQSLSVHLYSRWMRKFCDRTPNKYPPGDSWIGRWLSDKNRV